MTDPTPPAPARWGATIPEDAGRRYGVEDVTEAELYRASTVIELVTGAIAEFTAPLLSKVDRYWIDAATAYMVPFMRSHPDFFERMQASAFSQDGQSVTLDKDSLILPPLVRRALARLSWRGTRTLLPSRLRDAIVSGSYPLLPPGEGIRDYPGERWVPER